MSSNDHSHPYIDHTAVELDSELERTRAEQPDCRRELAELERDYRELKYRLSDLSSHNNVVTKLVDMLSDFHRKTKDCVCGEVNDDDGEPDELVVFNG